MRWQNNLKEATGQWAFVLSLSRNMIATLHAVRDAKPKYIGERDYSEGSKHMDFVVRGHFFTAYQGLKRRGLVEHHDQPADHSRYKPWTLTPAGVAVCELLVYAGLIPAEAEERSFAERVA